MLLGAIMAGQRIWDYVLDIREFGNIGMVATEFHEVFAVTD
jgi:hypothetical protein